MVVVSGFVVLTVFVPIQTVVSIVVVSTPYLTFCRHCAVVSRHAWKFVRGCRFYISRVCCGSVHNERGVAGAVGVKAVWIITFIVLIYHSSQPPIIIPFQKILIKEKGMAKKLFFSSILYIYKSLTAGIFGYSSSTMLLQQRRVQL